jgi:hypothetical protein
MSPAAKSAAFTQSTDGAGLATPPLFIFGCPRSGTTFLGELLNAHPRVLITNEIRLMAFLTEVFGRTAQNRHLLHNPDFKDQFVAHAKQRSALLVRTFYENLGRDARKNLLVWGDKTPGYADPLLSRGCLEFSREVFPDARWIHIRRDPRAVVHSLVAKKWHTVASAVDIWARITRAGREFGRRLPASQYLEIVHEDVLRDVESVATTLLKFVNLEAAPDFDAFVQREKVERQPISDPVNLARRAEDHAVHHGLTHEQLDQVISLLGNQFDDIEALLAHYEGTDQGRATAQAIASGSNATADLESNTLERVAAPQGFSAFTPMNAETMLGELEARLTGVSVMINGVNAVPSAAATVHAGDRVDIALRVMTLKHFGHLVAGFSIVDRAGQSVGGGNNANSGLGTLIAKPGAHTLLLSFRWPDLGDAPFTITVGIGEGTGSAADGESNHVQCWAPEALVLRQRPRTLPPGTNVTVNLMHASLDK